MLGPWRQLALRDKGWLCVGASLGLRCFGQIQDLAEMSPRCTAVELGLSALWETPAHPRCYLMWVWAVLP